MLVGLAAACGLSIAGGLSGNHLLDAIGLEQLAAAREPDSDEKSDAGAAMGGGMGPVAADRTDASNRVREGTKWQGERGTFTLVGDRVTFANQRNQNYVVLENLNLERIVRTIEENRTVTDADTLEWNIDATVTEYRGVNFILVTRSVLVARPRGTAAGR